MAAIGAGIGQGATIGAGLKAINRRAPSERRGEAALAFFAVIYVGLALPVIGVGVAESAVGLRTAGLAFSAIIATVVIALLASLARAQRA